MLAVSIFWRLRSRGWLGRGILVFRFKRLLGFLSLVSRGGKVFDRRLRRKLPEIAIGRLQRASDRLGQFREIPVADIGNNIVDYSMILSYS